MVGAEVGSLAQRRIWLNAYQYWRHIAMTHDCKSQSLDAMVSVQAIGDSAGSEVIRYFGNILVLSIVYGLWSVVPGLKPCVLANRVETVELMEYLDQGGVPSVIC